MESGNQKEIEEKDTRPVALPRVVHEGGMAGVEEWLVQLQRHVNKRSSDVIVTGIESGR